jgi:hypothetical protein
VSACTWSPGVVTEAELDAIATSPIGLRWAVGGPFRTFHLGGGPEGLPRLIQHLGPGLEFLCGQLGSPSFDAPTVELLVRQVQCRRPGRVLSHAARAPSALDAPRPQSARCDIRVVVRDNGCRRSGWSTPRAATASPKAQMARAQRRLLAW